MKENLPATQEESTGFPNALSSPTSDHKYKPLGVSGSDCADVFPSLSLIGKSHWRCKTAYELWLQKREKFSSERLRSGQSICTLIDEI